MVEIPTRGLPSKKQFYPLHPDAILIFAADDFIQNVLFDKENICHFTTPLIDMSGSFPTDNQQLATEHTYVMWRHYAV